MLELAIGRVPGAIVATASVLYLVCSLGVSISIVFLLGREWPGRDRAPQPEHWIGAAGILAFLYATGIRSATTNAKLARFTVKLTLALGIAVAIRMHPHWQRAWESMNFGGECGMPFNWWRILGAYAPFAFLAADLSRPALSHDQVKRVALFGFVLPCAVAIVLADFSAWTLHSMRPNLSIFAGFGPALWIDDSAKFIPAKAMVLALTLFGIGRLAVRMLDSLVPSRRIQVLLGCAIVTIASSNPDLTAIRDWTSAIVTVAAATVTARFLTPNSLAPACTGAAAYASGLLLARIAPGIETDSWLHAWQAPAYIATFCLALAIRRCGRNSIV